MAEYNEGKHTNESDARSNILRALVAGGCFDNHHSMRKSCIGFAAYPGYKFKAPQGAAFSVAKIVHSMERDGLIAYAHTEYSRGFYCTAKGRKLIEDIRHD